MRTSLVVALALVLAVASAVDVQHAETLDRARATHHAQNKLWFHLDDLLQQQDAAENGGEAHGVDFTSGPDAGASNELSGFEKQRMVKDKKGGATTVLANRNFMSIMEDAEGRSLNPALAAAEAHLQATEMASKKASEVNQKRNMEANQKDRATDEAKRKLAAQQKALNAAQGKAVEEVQKAEAKAEEINKRTLKEQQQRVEAAQKAAAKLFQPAGGRFDNFGGGYAAAAVTLTEGVCVFEGLMKTSNGGASGVGLVGTIPESCRPTGRLMFLLRNGGGSSVSRVDVLPDGRLYYVEGAGGTWLSLDGLVYNQAKPTGTLTLTNGWTNFGYEWRPSGYNMAASNKLCLITGLIRQGQWGQFATVPAECRPQKEKRLIFSGANHKYVTRIDVLANGQVLRAGGGNYHDFVALDGLTFSPEGGYEVAPLTPFANYGDVYRTLHFHRISNICVISGLVKSSDWARESVIAQLPSGCRPSKRLVFNVNSNDYAARVDIMPDGKMMYIEGKWVNWVSLSGIAFIARQ